MLDPVRYKKILYQLLKLLIVIELISAFSEGASRKDWGRFGMDLVIAGVLYIMWDRITIALREKKEEYRRKMERSTDRTRLIDALLFSLLWSDEIYRDIPEDRRRLVIVSYTLIAIGVVINFFHIGTGLMPLVLTGAVVLGGVNLLVWVVSLERGEKESLQTELKLAHDVQTSLMPKEQPRLDGYDIAGLSNPAREVGGDHFDFAGPRDGRFALSIFDVSGKGMQAAMAAVFTSGAFASEVVQSSNAGEILTNLNASVYSHSKRGHFVAFFLGVLDVQAKSFRYANAGQMKPALLSGGTIRWLDGEGVHFPLGMQESTEYRERQIQLAPGDVVLMLTDGITEAMNAERDQFGTDRLEAVLREENFAARPAVQMLDLITVRVRAFAGTAAQHDDMTMVVVKVL